MDVVLHAKNVKEPKQKFNNVTTIREYIEETYGYIPELRTEWVIWILRQAEEDAPLNPAWLRARYTLDKPSDEPLAYIKIP